jgi:hypothetical protein
MGGTDYLEGVSDRDITRYRAMAVECHTKAEHARHAPDREAWLKLSAEWNALAEDAARRRSNG